MSDLPIGWNLATVGDLVDRIEAGKNFRCIERPPEAGERGVVKVSAVSWGEFREDQSKTVPADVEVDERALIQPGDLLISRANTIELVGASVLVTKLTRRLYLSDKVLRLRAAADQRPWLHHYLSSPEARRQLATASSGNQLSMRNISQAAMLGLPIPVAPKAEQGRIVRKLDTVLARVEACRDHLDRVPAILKSFKQAVLNAAIDGSLTEEWGSTRAKHRDWSPTSVGQLLTDIRYGTSKKCEYEPKEVPVVRIPNLINGRVSHTNLKYASFEDGERMKLALRASDILMIRSNGSVELVGRTAVASLFDEGFMFAGYLIRLRPIPTLADAKFLSYALSSPSLRQAIEFAARSTSGVNNINIREIEALPISLPCIDEQREIVRRIESLFAWADRFEARYAAARAQVERLTPALLAKAFRGELVPQESADNA